MKTIWILGDQLNRSISSLRDCEQESTVILMVHSKAKLQSKAWHTQRAHLVVTSMRRFAQELRAEGFTVDERDASSLQLGLAEHRAQFSPSEVLLCEPMSYSMTQLAQKLEVTLIRSNQFICHYEDFGRWAGDKVGTRLEDFYRFQRVKTGFLMDGDEPIGGQWNFDHDNRLPAPKERRSWPEPIRRELDDLDHEVLASLPDTCWGAKPDGLWPTSRAHALEVLQHFIEHVLPEFGPYEDAMLTTEWRLNHSLLSSSLNIGLLHPMEVAAAVDAAYRSGLVPIASAEGFLRQILGWREYVWGTYWRWMPEYRDVNYFAAQRAVPPAFKGSSTKMACVSTAVKHIEERAYAHHIERLMILGNLALTAGVNPQQLNQWFWRSFIDGAEWVMLPNVLGMSQHADGGRMATKPYSSGGNYINTMSDYCKGCAFDPKKRVGDTACPFTTLYWDFLARHEDVLVKNHRVARQIYAMRKLSDLPAVRKRAIEVLAQLDAGTL